VGPGPPAAKKNWGRGGGEGGGRLQKPPFIWGPAFSFPPLLAVFWGDRGPSSFFVVGGLGGAFEKKKVQTGPQRGFFLLKKKKTAWGNNQAWGTITGGKFFIFLGGRARPHGGEEGFHWGEPKKKNFGGLNPRGGAGRSGFQEKNPGHRLLKGGNLSL